MKKKHAFCNLKLINQMNLKLQIKNHNLCFGKSKSESNNIEPTLKERLVAFN